MTEWEGQTGKYFARGQGVRSKRSEVRAPWPRAKYFPVRPDLTQSITILSYDHFFFHFHSFLVERGRVGAYASSRAVRVFPALSLRLVRLSYGTCVSYGNSCRPNGSYDKYLYVLYATRMYLYVTYTRMLLVCTRMYPYVPVCTRMFLVCGFCHDQMNLLVSQFTAGRNR